MPVREDFSIKFHKMTIIQNSPSFSVDISGDWSTPRFVCERDERKCFFPDGREAPILIFGSSETQDPGEHAS